MDISYIPQANLFNYLEGKPASSQDFVFLVSGTFNHNIKQSLDVIVHETIRVLKPGGILFVQGLPSELPELGVAFNKYLTFKYWFSIESTKIESPNLPSVHAAVLLFTKAKGRLNIKRVRLPHQICKACGRTLKDWGGKSHLMHPDGYVVSDVIKDIPTANNYNQMSKPLFQLLIGMLDFSGSKNNHNEIVNIPEYKITGMVSPEEGLAWRQQKVSDSFIQYTLPCFPQDIDSSNNRKTQNEKLSLDKNNLVNVIHQGDAISILKQYPDESVDLVFADPPYNLEKDYLVYDDEKSTQDYINWCNDWLTEYVRILKPTGSLFLLNLPRWSMHHAAFLNRQLHFQNWIVWDALSEPRGKVMPAHYTLLYYTKSVNNFTFNYSAVSPVDARYYCLRASCIRKRKQDGEDDKLDLTDIWWDIHRIKHRRDRDYHPCQLPEIFMERIIRLSTNPGDIVLDAFAGTGTTPLTALKLRRHYVAIDLDPHYVKIMSEKIEQINELGQLKRESVKRSPRSITKKALQLELRRLTRDLGRLPSQKDVEENSQYDLEIYLDTFSTWGKALKAAKLEIHT